MDTHIYAPSPTQKGQSIANLNTQLDTLIITILYPIFNQFLNILKLI